MVKHTQITRRRNADEWLECVKPFCGVGTQRVDQNNRFLLGPKARRHLKSDVNKTSQ